MKKIRTLLSNTTLALIAFSGILFSSCHKAKQTSNIVFQNYTFTPISITVNGSTTTIPVNGNVSFNGTVGSVADVSASTNGTYGLTYVWSFSDNFPSDGGATFSDPLDVDASVFYLEITNSDPHYITDLYVNYGLASETHELVSIPNSGNTYGVGYYKAFANTDVSVTYSDGFIYTTSALNISNSEDAYYNLFLN